MYAHALRSHFSSGPGPGSVSPILSPTSTFDRCTEWPFAKGAPWTVVAFAASRYDARAGAAAAAVAVAHSEQQLQRTEPSQISPSQISPSQISPSQISPSQISPSQILPQHSELWMFVDLAAPGHAVPWSYATSSP